VIHATLAQLPVATSAATGAQHLLPAAASFRPTTAQHALLTAIHAQRAIHATVEHLVVGKIAQRAMAQHLVASKTVRPELLTETHVRLAMTVHHALSIVTHAHRVTRVMVAHLVVSKTDLPELLTATHVRLAMVTHVQHALSIVTHAQRATHAMAAHVRHLALSIAQTHADHASSMTAHASSTATTATTAPTVVQTALTV
jgi:hypothetical protein